MANEDKQEQRAPETDAELQQIVYELNTLQRYAANLARRLSDWRNKKALPPG